ncbi:MAG: tetratricopeptide repeat protein [Phycisphaerae bacterium]
MPRIDQLEALLAAEPQDTFLRYALAMEYDKAGRNDESLTAFAALLTDDPNYVAAYFMAGKLLARLGRGAEARDYLTRGIAVAAKVGDGKAQREMTEALGLVG